MVVIFKTDRVADNVIQLSLNILGRKCLKYNIQYHPSATDFGHKFILSEINVTEGIM